MATGGTPPPLSVNPEELSAAGGALLNAANHLPEAPAPFTPVGTDPLSVAIIGQIPAVEVPIATQLPLIRAQATTTAENVQNAAQAYAATDARNGAKITQQMHNVPETPGMGSGGGGLAAGTGGAGGAGSAGQMMNTPMQMAGQMAQMPMQVMGAVAAVPQGIMQGAQQAGQQVQQMVGQFGQGGGGGQTGSSAGDSRGPETRVVPDTADDGAAAAEPDAELAPEAKEKADAPGEQREGRHRTPETDERSNM